MPLAEEPFDTREYWENRLSSKWGLHGVGHISYGKPYNQWLYRVRKRVFLRHVHRLSVDLSKATVLDVGSGTGFWLDVWRSLRVRNLVGSDLTHTAASRLRGSNPEIDILELDITDQDAVGKIHTRFDFISAFDVLYHIMQDCRLLNAISNVATLLRPGGYFIFTENFLHFEPSGSAHQVNRTLEEYEGVLKANGLEVVDRGPMFVLMQTPVDLKSRIPIFAWRLAMAPVRLMPIIGHLYGVILFPLELLFAKHLKESPSTEIMICRKAPS